MEIFLSLHEVAASYVYPEFGYLAAVCILLLKLSILSCGSLFADAPILFKSMQYIFSAEAAGNILFSLLEMRVISEPVNTVPPFITAP